MKKHPVLGMVIVFLLVLATACKPNTPVPTSEVVKTEATQPAAAIPTATPVEPTATSEPRPPAPEVGGIPSDIPSTPKEYEFQAMDGVMLQGVYYPGATNPAPLVVLMHWVNGDMHDWNEVAVWLQNRGENNPFTNPGSFPWWDPTWFPQVPADRSYGVFIFTFRGCKPMSEKGCDQWDIQGWMQDIEGAMMTAYSLAGVDPTRIAVIGSSIGADGAAYGCLFLNKAFPGACQGALSLSPGSFLVHKYPNVIKDLGTLQPPVPAWCIADEKEIGACKEAVTDANPLFELYEIPGGDHGNMLMSPNLEPLPMSLMLQFLDEVLK